MLRSRDTGDPTTINVAEVRREPRPSHCIESHESFEERLIRSFDEVQR